MYKETISRVIVGNKTMERFWTERGLRKEYSLSPLLFIIFIADVKKFLKKRQNGGVTIGRRKIYTLAYADLTMMAKMKRDMKKMLKSLERYFEEKRLTLNLNKSKILVLSLLQKGKRKVGNMIVVKKQGIRGSKRVQIFRVHLQEQQRQCTHKKDS